MQTITKSELFTISHKNLSARIKEEKQILVTAGGARFAILNELQPRQKRGVKIKECTFHEAVRHLDLIALIQEGRTIVKVKPDARREGLEAFYISEY